MTARILVPFHAGAATSFSRARNPVAPARFAVPDPGLGGRRRASPSRRRPARPGVPAAEIEPSGDRSARSEDYPPSAWRTSFDTTPPSARPLTSAITAPITLPASLGPAAPVRAIAARTSFSSSPSASGWGR